MISKKTFAIALAAALAVGASGVASATTISVGGVTWDTAQFDLTVASTSLIESSVANQNDVLHGFGLVGAINQNTNFCSGCQLAFTFQYTVSNVNNPTLQLAFDNGQVNFFVLPANSYNAGNPTNISSGTPWLTLTGHTGSVTGYPSGWQADLFSTAAGSISSPTNGSVGSGFLDAVVGPGSPAGMYMDTHTVKDGLGGFADFFITTNFQDITTGPFTVNGITYSINGGATLTGKSVSVPEPGALGMLGLGLGALGLFFWRRRKEAGDRA